MASPDLHWIFSDFRISSRRRSASGRFCAPVFASEAYNAGAVQIEQIFLDLLNLSRNFTDEEARHVREQLTEAELVVFDC
jgi:hypothetical protein